MVKVGIFVLFLIAGEKHFVSFIIEYHVSHRFFIDGLYRVEVTSGFRIAMTVSKEGLDVETYSQYCLNILISLP